MGCPGARARELARPDEFSPRAFPRPWSQILRNSSGDGERLPARGETISRGVRKRERAGGGRTIAFAGSESTELGSRSDRALASRTSGWGREAAGFRPWFAPRCGTCDQMRTSGSRCCVAKSATCRATRHMLFASALASRLASSALLSRVAVASSPRFTLARFGFPAGRVSDRAAGLWVSAARGKRSKTDSGGMRGVKKENLPTKTCVVCDRPFTWRKKWERCWDEVTTCSKSCNAARRREKQSGASGADESDGASDDGEMSDVDVIPSSPRGEGGDAKDASVGGGGASGEGGDAGQARC